MNQNSNSMSDNLHNLQDAMVNGKVSLKPPGLLESQQLSEKFNYERYVEITFKDLTIFSIFYIILYFVIFRVSREAEYQLTVKNFFEETKFDCVNIGKINMNEVRTMEQFWCFMSNFLVASFHWKLFYSRRDISAAFNAEDGNIPLLNNYMIGVPRLRQVRVTNTSCEVSGKFQHLFKNCYGVYSSSNEDTNPIIPVNEGRTGDTTCWTYSTSNELESLSYTTQIATYGGGGYYLDLTLDETRDRALLNLTKTNLWISRATRAIFIDFTTFNANVRLLCFFKLLFEFPLSGGVYPSTDFRFLNLESYFIDLTLYGCFVILCQFILVFFTIYFIIEEYNEFRILKYKSYLLSWWTVLDLLIITCLVLSILGQIIMCVLVARNIRKSMSLKLSEMKSYNSFDNLISFHGTHDSILSWTLLFGCLKFLRLLKMFSFLKILYQIIFQALENILAFLILILITIFAFGLLAHLRFGDKVYGLNTVYSSCCSLVLALVGNFDLRVLIKYDPFIGSTFCYFYIFIVFFMVLNISIAILNEGYWIRHKLTDSGTDENLWEPFCFKLQCILYKIGFKSIASFWYQENQKNKSEKNYKFLKNEIIRITNARNKETEEFLKNIDINEKNSANLTKDKQQQIIRDGKESILNKRIEELEMEVRKLYALKKKNTDSKFW